MVERLLLLLVATAVSFQAWLLASGNGPGSETIVWAPDAGNGFTNADWPIAVVWVVSVAALATCDLAHRRRPVLVALVVAATGLTFLTLTLLKGDGPDSGQVILTFGPSLGINSGDVPTLVAWTSGAVACALFTWRYLKSFSNRTPGARCRLRLRR